MKNIVINRNYGPYGYKPSLPAGTYQATPSMIERGGKVKMWQVHFQGYDYQVQAEDVTVVEIK